ncbi:MAG: alkaline phosphatase family protein [Sphingomonas sanxanigenens]|uniref:Alkaline phosphatase family protein n=1 Tax=Sphingomonas sanxanigenens TaxID=397260 RepID=A0A2W5AEJ3_9SPHN|nr:MAG: alkaline phosphatase family protein [Sphingomonas sanxanigenens]
MPLLRPLAAAAPLFLVSACATHPAPQSASAAVEAKPPVTILISIDGFRPDYLDRGVTPVLSGLAAGGVSAAMRPSFPSKTFPNHWTIVTGLTPDHNGIVANKMEDAARPGETFTMATDDPFWWNEATPLWVDAEKAGIRTATMFWPGSNVAIGGERAKAWPNAINGGTRPEDWAQFNQVISGTQRVNGVIDWLRRPAAIRPRFVTVYFDTVDTAGHQFGPGDQRTTAAVADVDATIGKLIDGLRQLNQTANIVIVADHGMAATSSERTIALDKIASPADYRIEEAGPYASLFPVAGHEAALEAALLKPHDHMQCWRKAAIPARFKYGTNPRIPPYFCLAETGWSIAETTPTKPGSGGNHGYDNQSPDMAALFIANGPAFPAGVKLAPFDNVDVAPLLRDLIGLPPATRADGTDAPFKSLLIK